MHCAHSVHCKRITQQGKIRFVAEFAVILLFAVFDCTNKNVKHCTAQNISENRRFCGIRNRTCGMQNSLWNPQTNNKTFV